MIEAIGSALLLGIILSFSLGPVFFELINTSLRRGFKSAFMLELGVVLSDVIYLIIALYSAEKVLNLIGNYPSFKYIGGSIFILFGVASILKNATVKQEKPKVNREDIIDPDEAILDKEAVEDKKVEVSKNIRIPRGVVLVFKGMTLNTVNPSVLIFWILTCSITIKNLENTGLAVSLFFGITLSSMFAMDVSKIYFASKLKRYMTPKILQYIGIVIGLIMVGAGIFVMLNNIQLPKGVS